jgi:hypothetical protein
MQLLLFPEAPLLWQELETLPAAHVAQHHCGQEDRLERKNRLGTEEESARCGLSGVVVETESCFSL